MLQYRPRINKSGVLLEFSLIVISLFNEEKYILFEKRCSYGPVCNGTQSQKKNNKEPMVSKLQYFYGS